MKLKSLKNVVLLFISTFLFLSVHGQDSTYYFGANHKPLQSEEGALFSKNVKIKNAKKTIVESFTNIDNQWVLTRTEKVYADNDNNYEIMVKPPTGLNYTFQRNYRDLGNGLYEFRESLDDKTIRFGKTSCKVPLILQDTVTEYFENGQVKTIAFYKDNQLKSNENWLKDGTKYIDNIFYSVDEVPEYISGQRQFNNFILANLINKKIDFSLYTQKIELAWVVNDSGKIEGIHVVKSVYPGLSNLIVEIIAEMPSDWQPATLNGEEVSYYMQFPINFTGEHDDNFNAVELSDGYLHWD